jgi:lipopolysaccharide export system protein LptC
MAVELHLPDLPEVPIAIGAPAPAAFTPPHMPWPLRLWQGLTAYLPLLLMALLAGATWWLVKNAPSGPSAAPTAAPATDPDYMMQRFDIQRFAPDGRVRVRLEGRELRHYPDGDRIEIDQVELRARSADGRLTTATARRAVSRGEVEVVRLEGGAQLQGEDRAGVAVRIDSDYLEALLGSEIVQTDRPVEVSYGSNRLRAAGLSYDARNRLVAFQGPVRAVLQVPRR